MARFWLDFCQTSTIRFHLMRGTSASLLVALSPLEPPPPGPQGSPAVTSLPPAPPGSLTAHPCWTSTTPRTLAVVRMSQLPSRPTLTRQAALLTRRMRSCPSHRHHLLSEAASDSADNLWGGSHQSDHPPCRALPPLGRTFDAPSAALPFLLSSNVLFSEPSTLQEPDAEIWRKP